MKKYVTELIGTFFLVLTVGLTAVYGSAGAMAPIAIGLVLAIMIYAGGPVSGGHFNPAVTIGVWLRGACPAKDVIPYIVAQVVGAILASLVACYLTGGVETTAMTLSIGPALVAEFLFTFALVFVVLSTATAKFAEGNSYFGLSIGGTVTVGAYSVGGISGGAFNPAVAVGLVVMGAVSVASIWIYLVACFLGGIAAALVFTKVTLAGD